MCIHVTLGKGAFFLPLHLDPEQPTYAAVQGLRYRDTASSKWWLLWLLLLYRLSVSIGLLSTCSLLAELRPRRTSVLGMHIGTHGIGCCSS